MEVRCGPLADVRTHIYRLTTEHKAPEHGLTEWLLLAVDVHACVQPTEQ